jgi:hypothetical protein
MTTLLQPKSRVLTVNGLRLHYLDWATLVLLHWCASTATRRVPRRSTRSPDTSRTVSTSSLLTCVAMGKARGPTPGEQLTLDQLTGMLQTGQARLVAKRG